MSRIELRIEVSPYALFSLPAVQTDLPACDGKSVMGWAKEEFVGMNLDGKLSNKRAVE